MNQGNRPTRGQQGLSGIPPLVQHAAPDNDAVPAVSTLRVFCGGSVSSLTLTRLNP